jgi:hypothetical protein
MRKLCVRLAAMTLCVLFQFAAVTQAAGVHHCPVHDAGMSLTVAGDGQPSQGTHHASAHHGEQGGAPDSEAPLCCCLDQGCSAALLVLPGEQVDRFAVVPVQMRRVPFPATPAVSARAAYVLPYANGPPAPHAA